MICQKCFKVDFRVFQGSFIFSFFVAWHSSQLPEQKEGLFVLNRRFSLQFVLAKKRQGYIIVNCWVVQSLAQIRIATISLEIPNIWDCLLSQLWLELEVWVSCSLESTGMRWGGGESTSDVKLQSMVFMVKFGVQYIQILPKILLIVGWMLHSSVVNWGGFVQTLAHWLILDGWTTFKQRQHTEMISEKIKTLI